MIAEKVEQKYIENFIDLWSRAHTKMVLTREQCNELAEWLCHSYRIYSPIIEPEENSRLYKIEPFAD